MASILRERREFLNINLYTFKKKKIIKKKMYKKRHIIKERLRRHHNL